MTDQKNKPATLPEEPDGYMAEFARELAEREKTILEEAEKSFFIRKNWEKVAKTAKDEGDHYRAAFLFKKLGNLEETNLHFIEIAKGYKKKKHYLKSAYLFEKTGDLREAAELLEKWYSFHKNDPYSSDETQNPRIYLRKLTELYQQLNDVKKLYQLLIHDKKYEKAAGLLIKNGLDKKAAVLLEKTHFPLKAADIYEKIGQGKKANLMRAEVAHNKSEYDRAGEYYQKAGDYIMAAEQFQNARKWVKAAECFALNGNYKYAADSYLRSSNLKEAIEMFEFAGEWENAADNLYKIKEYAKAGEYYARSGFFFKAGESFTAAHDKELAVKNFQKVTESSEDFFRASIEVSKLFLEDQKSDLVISKLKDLDRSQMSGDIKNELRYTLARAFENRVMLKEAEDLYNSILKDDYHYQDVLKRLENVGKEKEKYELLEARREDATKRYKILRKLGEGGMGVVYKAEDLYLNRTVALKQLKESYAKDHTTFEMFRKEARAIAALSHPNIVKIFDFGQMYEDYFICMEYLEGKDLYSVIQIEGKYAFSIKEIIRFTEEMAKALSYAHSRGIIHQDIKPHNMILTDDQELKIMDFGIASIMGQQNTEADNMIIGTPSYMAPEQITKKNVSQGVDIYSAGITLFYLLAGEVPFKGDNLFSQHLNEPPPSILNFRPETPSQLVTILEKCLKKLPQDRFKTGQEILNILNKIDPEVLQDYTLEKKERRKSKSSSTETIGISPKNPKTSIHKTSKTVQVNTKDTNDQTASSKDSDKTTFRKTPKKKVREKTAKINYPNTKPIQIKKQEEQ